MPGLILVRVRCVSQLVLEDIDGEIRYVPWQVNIKGNPVAE